jgi:CheY-like chemotaxis protein
MRILVVDDYPDAALASCALLELLGHECRPALSGEAALREVATFTPDIVLLDLDLPGRTGYEVAREIRAVDAQIFLAAMSGLQHDAQLAVAAGFDAHLAKPASAAKLAEVVNAAVHRHA